jgi:bifunctional non-homologous end joining protein LigD
METQVQSQRTTAIFIEPMLLRRVERLPEGRPWIYELKLDGYRAVAAKAAGKVHLWSRNENDFSPRFPTIAAALAKLPEDTVIDGEIVALDDAGKPSFNALQNYSSSKTTLVYYVFDVMILAGRDLRQEKLTTRRELLAQKVLSRLSEPIRSLPDLPGTLTDLIEAVRREGLEGLVAKNSESAYEAGERSGRWSKMRINEGQEFVIGGNTVGSTAFDALVFGYYEGSRLLYAARTRNGFTPALRQALMKRFRGLETTECPFANLPEKKSGRWGQGLTAAKMKDCRWLKPKLVAQFEFVEWTPDNHLRHSRFIALREDKPARSVFRETAKGNEKLDRSSRDETDWLNCTGRPVRDRNEPSA